MQILHELPPYGMTFAEYEQEKRAAAANLRPPIPQGFKSAKQMAIILGVTPRRVRALAKHGRFRGAVLHEVHGWLIPDNWKLTKGQRGPKTSFT